MGQRGVPDLWGPQGRLGSSSPCTQRGCLEKQLTHNLHKPASPTESRLMPELSEKFRHPSFGWGSSEEKAWAWAQQMLRVLRLCHRGLAVPNLSANFDCHGNSIRQVQSAAFSPLDVKESLFALGKGDCQL